MTKLYAAFDETNIGPTSPKDLKIGPISVVLFSLSEKLVGLKDIRIKSKNFYLPIEKILHFMNLPEETFWMAMRFPDCRTLGNQECFALSVPILFKTFLQSQKICPDEIEIFADGK